MYKQFDEDLLQSMHWGESFLNLLSKGLFFNYFWPRACLEVLKVIVLKNKVFPQKKIVNPHVDKNSNVTSKKDSVLICARKWDNPRKTGFLCVSTSKMMWPLITQFSEFNYFNEYEGQIFVKKLQRLSNLKKIRIQQKLRCQ